MADTTGTQRGHVTRFGLQIPSFTFPDTPDNRLFDRIAEIAETAESSGFDSVWVMDHFYQLPGLGTADEPMLEAYTLLGGLAARTSRARLGTMVTGVTYRNPALLAKIITTLDIVSAGRAILGLGAAWHDVEHTGYGFDFPGAGERLDRLDEALQICRAMFTEERPSFAGKYYQITEALNSPRPVTPGGPPILVGGGGEKRTLRLVARYADAWNGFGDIATIQHKLSVLAEHCAAEGRDPAAITKTKLATLMVAPTAAEAQAKAAPVVERVGEEWARSALIHGDVAAVAAQVREHLDAGLDGLIVNIPDVNNLDTVRLAGEALNAAL